MTQIFQPRGVPFFGNTGEIDPTNLSKSFVRLAKLYGPVVRLNLGGEQTVLVNQYDVANDVFEQKLFTKKPAGTQIQARNGVGDGLFTAFNEEENWGIAHRVLMPRLGPIALHDMFPEMHEICCQLVSKWAREGPCFEIDPTVEFTKLTLDSIAICAMGCRFNSFLKEGLHPFPTAMVYFLKESAARSMRPAFLNDYVYRSSNRKYWDSIETMRGIAGQAIQERRDHPVEKPDILNAMLYGVDPKTGKSMSEQSIINNAMTLLIAGHETTSGLLSFLFTLLLLSPSAMHTAQEEVDRVIGRSKIVIDHLSQLPYINACLRESLRLWPTAPFNRRAPRSESDDDFPLLVGKERYQINKDDVVTINTLLTHRDPAIFPDPEAFLPERMLEENFNKLPPNAWKPFGSGPRSCIGRAFAWQEALLATAMLLQNFTFEACDPSYRMDYKSTLTIKPVNFRMRAALRNGLTPASVESRIWGGIEPDFDKKETHEETVTPLNSDAKKPMTILYGSNSGTCESLAHKLANTASARGYAPAVKSLDSGVSDVAKDHPLAIITSSYEGEPPDNACHFVEWANRLKPSLLQQCKFAVFGCGNRNWVNTYQKIPHLIDRALAGAGATRITASGDSDVAQGHISDDFDTWVDSQFWPGLEKTYGGQSSINVSTGLDVELEPGSRAADLRSDVKEGIVLENKVLTAVGEPVKKHIKLQLPSGSTYASGDYLAVLPVMPESTVRRVMARFNIAWDERIIIHSGQHTFLPSGKSIPVFVLLSTYLELNLPCTKKQLAILVDHIEDQASRDEAQDITPEEISSERTSVLDFLEKYPTCCLPFGDFLSMLDPLRVRQYSISSSAVDSPETCTLTYGVLDQEAKVGGKRFLGAASNFLSHLAPGDKVQISVRASHKSFHLPADVGNVPIIMVCAGTGLAPFHGFVEERAKQKKAGQSLAPALLFIGCRDIEKDALYADEFSEWVKEGVVDVRYALSHTPEKSKGCKYVQDRLWKDRNDARALWSRGGRIYVCGSPAIGEAIKEVYINAVLETKGALDDAEERRQAEELFNSIRNERFASDIFA